MTPAAGNHKLPGQSSLAARYAQADFRVSQSHRLMVAMDPTLTALEKYDITKHCQKEVEGLAVFTIGNAERARIAAISKTKAEGAPTRTPSTDTLKTIAIIATSSVAVVVVITKLAKLIW